MGTKKRRGMDIRSPLDVLSYPYGLPVLLLVTVLTKPLLALMRRHLMTLALLSAWHRVTRVSWVIG